MSNHIIEWLNAYVDGELKGMRLRQVDEHLTECEACQAELDSYKVYQVCCRKSLCQSSHRMRSSSHR